MPVLAVLLVLIGFVKNSKRVASISKNSVLLF